LDLRGGEPSLPDRLEPAALTNILIYVYSYVIKGRAELKVKRKISRRTNVTKGSRNVFAELGLRNADQELMKARLTLQIYRIIKDRGLTQTEAGKILGIPQPHVSALARNRAGNFSVGRLLDFLTALGQDVEITVRPTRKEHGEMSVVVA